MLYWRHCIPVHIYGYYYLSDGNGKEVISLYTTKIDNRQVFWGDLNARQMLWHKYELSN